MKRRDIAVERAHWDSCSLFKRGRRLRRVRALWKLLIVGALGFSAVLIVGVLLYGPAGAVTEGWPMEQAQR